MYPSLLTCGWFAVLAGGGGEAYFWIRFLKTISFHLKFFFHCLFNHSFPWRLRRTSRTIPRGPFSTADVLILPLHWVSDICITFPLLLLPSCSPHSTRGEWVSCSKTTQEKAFSLLCALSAFCLVWFLHVDNRISVSSQVSQTSHYLFKYIYISANWNSNVWCDTEFHGEIPPQKQKVLQLHINLNGQLSFIVLWNVP